MAANDVNTSYNVGTHNEHGDEFQHDDLTSETCNEGDETTPVHEGQNPRHGRNPSHDNADDKHIVETIKIFREQQREFMDHLSRQDQVMKELKQALSGAFNNSNGRAQIPPSIPANPIVQRTDNDALREKFGFKEAGGTSSGSGNNTNAIESFKIELMRFMREMNERIDQNAKEFHARMDQIRGASSVLKGQDSQKYTQLPFKPSVPRV